MRSLATAMSDPFAMPWWARLRMYLLERHREHLAVWVLENSDKRCARVQFDSVHSSMICDFEGRSGPFAIFALHPSMECPECREFERHRLQLYIEQQADRAPKTRQISHFAPELCSQRCLGPLAKNYLISDLMRGHIDHYWDITALDGPDNTVATVVCSHVSERVDSGAAVPELLRVLKPDGAALIMVPNCEESEEIHRSDEIQSDEARWQHFQQPDHTLIDGRNFRQILTATGFALTEFVATIKDAALHALTVGERIFVARKPCIERAAQ